MFVKGLFFDKEDGAGDDPENNAQEHKESKKVESKPNIDAKILSFIQGSSLNF